MWGWKWGTPTEKEAAIVFGIHLRVAIKYFHSSELHRLQVHMQNTGQSPDGMNSVEK